VTIEFGTCPTAVLIVNIKVVLARILPMVYCTQNHWVSGLGPSSGILNTRKHNVSDVFPSSGEENTPTLLGPLERASLNHWTTYVRVQVQVILRPTVSRPVRLGVASLLEQVTRGCIYLSNNYFLSFSCRAPTPKRGRVCNLQCNQFQVILPPTVCRPVRLGAGPPLGSKTRF
jgi:hypothetical protein